MEKRYDLVITVVNRGFAEDVMDAARSEGAEGGTIVNARGTGIHETETFFGIVIEPEKDLVLMLVEHEHKHSIMEKICQKAGLNTEGRGISFSLPVEDVAGIVHKKI